MTSVEGRHVSALLDYLRKRHNDEGKSATAVHEATCMEVVWSKSIEHATGGQAIHTLSKRSLKLDSLSDNACNTGQTRANTKMHVMVCSEWRGARCIVGRLILFEGAATF